jgi:hypothetical protein
MTKHYNSQKPNNKRRRKSNVILINQQCIKRNGFTYRGGGGGGGGRFDLAKPTHATMPTARINHPAMSYFRVLSFFFF